MFIFVLCLVVAFRSVLSLSLSLSLFFLFFFFSPLLLLLLLPLLLLLVFSLSSPRSFQLAFLLARFACSPNLPTPHQSDISGATPTVSRRYRKPNTFDTSDIPGAQSAQKKHFASTKRRTNPLNPEYPLPKAKPAEYPVPKFLRDSLRKDDIPFASSGEHKKKIKPRETMKIGIEGAQAGWKPFAKRVHNGKNFEKYYEEKIERTSKRRTDPQNPTYKIHGQVIDQKSVTGSAKPNIKGHNGNLRTKDIDGAITGTIRYTELDPVKRRHFRVTNQTKDIRGAQVRGLKAVGMSSRFSLFSPFFFLFLLFSLLLSLPLSLPPSLPLSLPPSLPLSLPPSLLPSLPPSLSPSPSLPSRPHAKTND